MPRVMRISFPPGSPGTPYTLPASAVAARSTIGAVTFQRTIDSPEFDQYTLFDGPSGPRSTLYNLKFPSNWDNFCGDWLDAAQTPQGTVAYSTITIGEVDVGVKVFAGLAALVNRWLAVANRGVLLRATGSDWSVYLAGRLYQNSAFVPYLAVTTDQGSWNCPVTATCTVGAWGTEWFDARAIVQVQATGYANALMQFDLSAVVGNVTAASMYVYVHQGTGPGHGTATVRLYEMDPPAIIIGGGGGAAIQGIAQAYPSDAGLDAHPDVLWVADLAATNSENETLTGGIWDKGGVGYPEIFSKVVEPDGNTSYRSGFLGPEYTAYSDRLYGGDVRRYLTNGVDAVSTKPTSVYNELYFRYYVYLENDYGDTTSGSKMPGISGTWGEFKLYGGYRLSGYYDNNAYGSGNGAGPVSGLYEFRDGRYFLNGWSQRGFIGNDYGDGNPYDQKFFWVGNYVYYMDKENVNGDNLQWGVSLQKNAWYCIEQYCKMNTLRAPYDALGNGEANYDGVYKAWVDGVLVYDSQVTPPVSSGVTLPGFRWTRHPDFGVMGPWMDWFHGGTVWGGSNPERTQHYRMRNIVCATSYIGPTGEAGLPSWVPQPNRLAIVPITQSMSSQVASYYSPSRTTAVPGGVFDFSAPCASLDWGTKGGLVMYGGGHSATNDNSVFVFDIDTRRWIRLTQPYDFGLGPYVNDTADVSALTDDSTGEYPDGQPASVHSYATLDIVPSAHGGGINGALVTAVMNAIGSKGTNPNDATVAHQIYLAQPFTETWQRVSTTIPFVAHYPGQSSAYDPSRNRVWNSWQGTANQRNNITWFDLTSQQYGTQYFSDYNWSQPLGTDVNAAYMRYDVAHDALILTVANAGGNTPVAYFRCQDPARGWRLATLSTSIPSGTQGHIAFGFCSHTGKWYFISNQTRDRVYEVSIPADITQPWTVTPVMLGGGQTFPMWFMVGKAWTYFPSVKCFFLVYNATDIYAYRPTGV